MERILAADCPIFYLFTIPRSLLSPLKYHYFSLVIKALRGFPQFKEIFLFNQAARIVTVFSDVPAVSIFFHMNR